MTRFTTTTQALVLSLILTLTTTLSATATSGTPGEVHPTTGKLAAYDALPYIHLSRTFVSKTVKLYLPDTEVNPVTAIVLNANGTEVATLPVVAGRLNLASLAPGTYFLEVHGTKTYRASLIKV